MPRARLFALCLSVGLAGLGRSNVAFAGGPLSSPRRADGLLPGTIPWRGNGSESVVASAVCPGSNLIYYGGPIAQNPIVVPVYWSTGVNASLVANMPQFYADVMNSTYWSWLAEYDSVGHAPGSNQAILTGTAHAGVTITPVKCAPGANPCSLTDADVQTELKRQIGLGTIPAPTLDCTGNANTIYMVHFAPNISLAGPDGAGHSCVAAGFCAYHYTGTYGPTSIPLLYGAVMDYFSGPCAMGCAGEATGLGKTTDIASHELAEAVTDADIGLVPGATVTAPAAWYDPNCGEIADICSTGAVGDTIVVSGRSWFVQQLWSNQQVKCTSTGPTPTICSGTTVTGCRKCSCGDSRNACGGATSVCETSSGNVLFGACEQCTAANNPCPGGDTCLQSTTPSQDDVCFCPLAPPVGATTLTESQPVPGTARLSWTYSGSDANAFDAVRGDLPALRSPSGNFSSSTSACLADGSAGPVDDASVPALGGASWYLLRAVNCGGKGPYGSTARDTGIPASGNDCP